MSSSHIFLLRNTALFVLSCGGRGCHLKTPPVGDNDRAKIKYAIVASEIFSMSVLNS